MNVAIVGASSDREKFGNKAVRAYLKQGHRVFPVNPTAKMIENLQVYPDLKEIPAPLEVISIYLPPAITEKILDELSTLEPKPETIYVNPGAESEEVEKKAHDLHLPVKFACSIRAIGEDPANYT